MGGKHLTVTCNVSRNGYSVSSSALVDSGANGFLFIDTLCALDIARFLGVKALRLPRTFMVKGYDGKLGKPISHYLRLHLTINGRRQYNVPLLILDLGSHDLIIGRKWLDFFNILVDARNRCLQWPESLQPSHSVVREITVSRQALGPQAKNQNHQADADSRDQAMAKEDRMLGIGPPDQEPTSNLGYESGCTTLSDLEKDPQACSINTTTLPSPHKLHP